MEFFIGKTGAFLDVSKFVLSSSLLAPSVSMFCLSFHIDLVENEATSLNFDSLMGKIAKSPHHVMIMYLVFDILLVSFVLFEVFCGH